MIRKLTNGFIKTSGYCADEIKMIVRDPGTLLILVIAMFIYPIFYSLAYVNEVIRDIPVAVVDLDHTSTSRQCSRMLDASEQLRVTEKPGSIAEAEQLFYNGEVKGVVLIPENFEKNIMRGIQSNITVYSDASYFLYYKQVYAGAVFAGGTLSAGVEVKRALNEKKTVQQAIAQQDPLKTETFTLYNPSGGYASLVMPGMILIIMQQTLLMGIGMLGGTIRRKDRYGRYIDQMSRLGGTIPVVLGKASAYVFIYLFNALFAMVLFHHWLNFPDKSGFLPSLIILVPFLFAVSFFGLAVSVFFRDRAHSLMFFIFLSPIILFFSGISWPTEAIPQILYHTVSQLFPTTNMIPAYIRLRICGASLFEIRYEIIFLILQSLVYFVLACLAFKIVPKRIHLHNPYPYS